MKPMPIALFAAAVLAIGYYAFRPNEAVENLFQPKPQTGLTAVSDTSPLGPAPSEAPPPSSPETQPPASASAPPPVIPVVAQVPPAPGAASPQIPAVDETALRYFARRGDSKRLEAEIARLRTLYPDWTPPTDPTAVTNIGDPKLDAMWQLYSENRFAEVRKAIADRGSAEPGWQAPKDLLDRLSIAEGRERLINASNLKQYAMVVRVGASTPSLLTCSEVDVLWRIAEAFANTDRPERAKDAYLYILNNCSDPAERLATVEKAIPVLPRPDLEALFATERTGADGKGEFDTARVDLARRSVGDAGKDAKLSIPEGDVRTVEAAAEKDGLASDAILLGWYYIRRDKPEDAEKWFRKARGVEDTAEVTQGLALALVDLGRHAEAEDVLYPWNDSSDEIRNVYLAAVANLLAEDPLVIIDPTVLQRMAPVVAKARDAAAAQQFGWYARALNQHGTAGQWFETALTWKPDDEPSAYGLALTRLQLGDKAGVAEIQRLWAGRSERIATLGETRGNRERRTVPLQAPSPSDPIAPVSGEERPTRRTAADPASQGSMTAGGGGSVAERVARLPQRRSCKSSQPYSNLGSEQSLARGWCLMDLNRPLEAVQAFERAISLGNAAVRQEAAWGQSLAYLRSGLANDAAVAASKSPQDRERTAQLDEALLSRRATDFFDAGRYAEAILALDQRARIAPERIDLMVLRGYAYLNLKRKEDARRVFRAIAATGDREGLRGLKAVDPPKDNQ